MTDVTAGRLPTWERLRAPDQRPLRVEPLRHLTLDTAHLRDGDLVEADGATVFDAWHDAGIYTLRAARIDDARASPYVIVADRIRVEDSDGRLEALLGERVVVAVGGELERQACACRGIAADAVYRSISTGWRTVEQLKRATRVTFGVCQGRRCVPWLADRLELSLEDSRAVVRPRPPLVPVPARVLAAFAATG